MRIVVRYKKIIPNQSVTHTTDLLCLHRECVFHNVAVRSGYVELFNAKQKAVKGR